MINKTIIYILAGLLVFLGISWLFSNILLYFVISMVLSTFLKPLTGYISQVHIFSVKVHRALAVLLSFITLLIIMSLFVLLFVPLVSEQIQILSRLNYEQFYYKLALPVAGIEEFMLNNDLVSEQPGFIVENLRENIIDLVARLNVRAVINSVISVTGNILVGVLAVTFITFFLLYEKGVIRKRAIALIPNSYFEVTIAAVYKIEKLLSNYLIGLLFQMMAIFSLASLGLSIMGIKYALTIAVFAAVANLIPYAGPLLGSAFGIIVGISTGGFGGDTNAYIFLVIKIISVFGAVQMIDNIVLQPLIFSKSVKAHPLEIFVIIFAGANLGGVVGMIAAIPVYTIIRVSVLELIKGYNQYHIFKMKN